MDALIPRCHHGTSIVLLSLLCLKVSSTSTPCTICDGNNVTCVDGVCLPRCVNVTSSGECRCRDSRFYGKQCEHDCPDNCLNSRCQMDNTRVVCTEGCVAGKKGDNCGATCPTACTQCERYGDGCTGPCHNPRYYGPHCRTPCSSNCTDVCNRITGECGSCEPGYTGDKCNVTCPPNCKDGCDKDTGECGSCEPGYTGTFCAICNTSEALSFLKPRSTCDGNNVTCVDGVCPPRCVSVTSSGGCLQCRDSRFYGKHCEHDCPDTCLNSRCQMNDTRVVCTEGCVAGKKGDNCGVTCPTACTQCERYGDGCTGPCHNPRYYGPHCRTLCSSSCRDGCNRITGECDSCEPGYTGDKCDVTCSPNCRDGCDKDTGECDSCMSGYRGKNCNDACPSSCSDGCDKETGKCEGCNPGNSGKYCNISCPITCTVGCNQDGGCNVTGQASLLEVGSVLLAMTVAASILLLVIFLWKRRKRRRLKICQNKERAGEMHSLNNTELRPHGIHQNPSSSERLYTSSCKGADLQQVTLCEELKSERSSERINDEFQRLSCPDIDKAKYGSLDDNAMKNRYTDVLPYDSTRVSLEIDEQNDSDYINASFIDGYIGKIQYIAAQGPSIEVVADFWRMIWQLNITKIVMLTNLVEAGRVKCEMYWPFCSSDFSTYGTVYVQCVEEKVYKNYTLRKLAVWKENSHNRIIRQFHFTSWPDHGVPGETTSILDFHRVVKDTGTKSFGPLLIHCSAGIGRTGTFLALDYLLDQARKEGRVCVYNCVQNLRHQRMKMVQTKEQYAFIYKALVSALKMRGNLQRCQNPIAVLCGDCWQQRKDNRRSNASLQKDMEYQRLWHCQLQRRNSYLPRRPSPPLDEYAIISENTPPRLHRSLNAYSIDADMDTWMDTSV